MSLSASRYFSIALLAFIAGFVLLPSSKAVNNFFYIFMALPAVILLLAGRFHRFRVTFLTVSWAAFFCWLALSGIGDSAQYFKHLLYVVLFCFLVFAWVDWRQFEKALLFRSFFWGLVLYVAVSAIYFWYSGQTAVGVRIISLPGRLDGPILTSMLMVSCFVLLLPEWLRDRGWWEMGAAVAAILFCVGFVLQSRSGLVGLAAALIAVFIWMTWKAGWKERVLALLMALVIGVIILWVLKNSDVAARLISRADAGRLELWKQYLADWLGCGFLLGCGADFYNEVRNDGGEIILHPHNLLLTVGFRYGFVGVLLFSVSLMAALWEGWRQKSSWAGFLLVSLFMLNFDGRELINSPHEVWLLVLMPAMLIAARQQSDLRA